MKIIEIIKKIRKEKGYTQTDIAKLLNIAQPTYADIENERIQLKAEDFIKICYFLNLDIINFIDQTETTYIKINDEQAKFIEELNKQIQTNKQIKINSNNTITIGNNNTNIAIGDNNNFNKK